MELITYEKRSIHDANLQVLECATIGFQSVRTLGILNEIDKREA